MTRTTARTTAATIALAATALVAAGAAPASAATSPASLSLVTSAYGSTASVGAVSSGKTAYFSSCATTSGATYGNDVAVVDLGGALGKVGAGVTTGVRSGDTVTSTSTIGETSLLGGVVKLKTLASRSTTQVSGGVISSSGSTTITGLSVAGLPRTVPTGVGSTIDVPGVAKLTFNSQRSSTTYATKQFTVDALRVDLLQGNKLGLAAGSIVLGSSTSGGTPPTSFPASGQAYGTQVKVGTLLTSGASAYKAMPCGGTNGSVSLNNVAGVDLPGLLTVGAVSSSAQSVQATGSTTARFGNTVTGVNLLGGAVTADAVTARSATTRTAAGYTTTSSGTSITNLKVLGEAVDVTTKDNSVIQVAGVGTLTLRKTVKQVSGLDVTGLELKVGTDQPGVKAGTVIQVAVAQSKVAAG